MAMLPAPPGLFSTTNCCPSPFDISAEKARATIDELPPGAKGTTRRIGLFGYVWACAAAPQHAAAANTAIFDSMETRPPVLRGGAHRRTGLCQQLAQHERQGPAVPVVVRLDRRG